MTHFWRCFVQLFVAMDAIGGLVTFLGLVSGLDRATVRRVILQSVITAAIVALAFVAVGEAILKFLQVKDSDFMIAGGTLLFILSISELLKSESGPAHVDPESLGAVPVGVPLIVGPAVLTSLILLRRQYADLPLTTITLALVANIAITGVVFWLHEPLTRLLGKVGAKAVSKVASLFLAAIGVMLVRRGVLDLIKGPT